MTNIKMLPLPEWTKRDDAGQNMVPSEIRVSMSDYARAVAEHNVKLATAELHRQFGCELRDPNGTIWDHAAKLQAENEALRAERDSFQRVGIREQERAERLAEALRDARQVVRDLLPDATYAKWDAALRDHDQEGK